MSGLKSQKETMSTFCARYLFNAMVIGFWVAVGSQQPQVLQSLPDQETMGCSSHHRIELKNYELRFKGSLKPANFDDALALHKACSRQQQCTKPSKNNNRNWEGLHVNYSCADERKMKHICKTAAGSYTSQIDVFYDGKLLGEAANCRCILNGNFTMFLVDLRLLNKKNKCSQSYVNIRTLEKCVNCLNYTYSCFKDNDIVYRKVLKPMTAKIAISAEHLNHTPQMIWFRIHPHGIVDINCGEHSADTATPTADSNKGLTEDMAASSNGDDGLNALEVAVPVLAVLLLVAACIIGFLLYRRCRSIKKDRNDSSTGKTLSDITSDSAVAKDVSDDSMLETSQRVSVLNEYSTIQDITAAASVPPTTDEGYYTIKDKEKNEYNLLSLNAPQIPNDPSYGHITEDGSGGLDKTYNHTNEHEHLSKDVSSRPKLEVPVNGSKPNVENKLQEPATSTQDNSSLNTESITTGVDGYSHFGKAFKVTLNHTIKEHLPRKKLKQMKLTLTISPTAISS